LTERIRALDVRKKRALRQKKKVGKKKAPMTIYRRAHAGGEAAHGSGVLKKKGKKGRIPIPIAPEKLPEGGGTISPLISIRAVRKHRLIFFPSERGKGVGEFLK